LRGEGRGEGDKKKKEEKIKKKIKRRGSWPGRADLREEIEDPAIQDQLNG
jgi:hypothetical protein